MFIINNNCGQEIKNINEIIYFKMLYWLFLIRILILKLYFLIKNIFYNKNTNLLIIIVFF